MHPRRLPFACLALIALGLAWAVPAAWRAAGAGPEAGEATPLLVIQSLWYDHNLRFEAVDLARAERLWAGGPRQIDGLALLSPDGGATFRYAVPLAWPLAALPVYAVLGARGLPLLNAALYLGLFAFAAAGLRGLRSRDVGGVSGPGTLLLAGTFFASAALPAVFRHGPEVFVTAGVLLPLLAWRRWREGPAAGRAGLMLLAGAGAWLAAAALTWEPAVLLALPIAADLVLQRRRRELVAVAAGLLFAAAGLIALQARLCHNPFPLHDETRRTYAADFPVAGAAPTPLVATPPTLSTGAAPAPPPIGTPAGPPVGRALLELVAGRHGGLLPAFPFALFALGLYLVELRSGPRDRSRQLLAGALVVAALWAALARPESPGPGPALGLLAPAFLLLPRGTGGRSLLLPYAAAGLWTAGLVLVGLGAAPPALVHAAPYRLLAPELTRLRELPGLAAQAWGEAVWVVPEESFWTTEQHPRGVWVRGATISEVIVVTPRPLAALRVWVWSLSETNVLTVDTGGDEVTVRFDTPGKRAGTPLVLHPRPVARGLGFLPGAPEEAFYQFRITTTDGAVPARKDPQSGDTRFLGVFLDFTGRGP
jgi:hypothetical protein